MSRDKIIEFDFTIPENSPLWHELNAYDGDPNERLLELFTIGYASEATFKAVSALIKNHSKIRTRQDAEDALKVLIPLLAQLGVDRTQVSHSHDCPGTEQLLNAAIASAQLNSSSVCTKG